jgi:hypothetical protein
MRGVPILLIFFLMFTAASVMAPFPMFPGNFVCATIGSAVTPYALYLGAALNGLFYGVLIWLVFVGISKKLEQEV